MRKKPLVLMGMGLVLSIISGIARQVGWDTASEWLLPFALALAIAGGFTLCIER